MNAKVRGLVFLLCVSGICVFWRGYMTPFPQVLQTRTSSLCACPRCLSEHDPWFMKHFDKSVQPFLSARYNLSEGNFNWWKIERRSFSFYRTTVKRLFQMFPHSPDVTESSPNRCRTCAVVGNSGNLRASRYGPLIDFHDIIIRMNHARIEGYEADVGTRTTHRVMYPESAVDLDNTTHLVLAAFKIMDLEWVEKAFTTGFHGYSYGPMKPKIKANKDLVMIINPAFMRYVHDMWLGKKGSYPSTGFITLVLAMHICDEVSVFGFGADSRGSWGHYWEKLKNEEFKTGIHPGNQEYEMIEQLAVQKKIRFYKGW